MSVSPLQRVRATAKGGELYAALRQRARPVV